MYPILYKIESDEGRLDRVVIAYEPGIFEEFRAGETLFHENQDNITYQGNIGIYDTPESGERYLKAALFIDSNLLIKMNASSDEIEREIDRIKRRFKSQYIPKRDRKRR